jgi:hypothetical protein
MNASGNFPICKLPPVYPVCCFYINNLYILYMSDDWIDLLTFDIRSIPYKVDLHFDLYNRESGWLAGEWVGSYRQILQFTRLEISRSKRFRPNE